MLPTLYQQYIHLSRYARWDDKLKRRESWEETVDRYMNFFIGKFPIFKGNTEENVRKAILNLEVMPSMRALMTAGPALERENICGYNCFAGHVRYLTEEGYKTFEETVGTSQIVLNGKGQWVPAEIREFGTQRLQIITFRPGSRSKTNLRYRIVATPDHRWITMNRGEITDLRVGDVVSFIGAAKPELSRKNLEAFVRGFGFGDGTIDQRGRARVRLCGKKNKWLEYFKILEEDGYCAICYPPSSDGDAVVIFRKGKFDDWKQLPKEENVDYLAWWLEGYLAADGHGDPRQPGISSQDREAIEFVKKIAPMAGYMVTGHNVSRVMETNYGTRSEVLHRLTLRHEGEFKVMAIEELDVEETVYCAVVPDGHDFVLEHGIHTGNCSYLAIDRITAFDEILYILMCGTGVGFSVERQFINNLPVVADSFYERPDIVIKVADSKIGWAKSLRELIHLLYGGQIPNWDVSKVRKAGERLKTMGGRASGPEPLVELFKFTVKLFKNAAGRKLTSIECHDLVCKIAEIVVVGGVRRCLPGNAQVFTPTGPKPIKDIKVGDTIVTGGETGRVVAAGVSGVRDTIVIKHRFGQLECTPDHRVAVFNSIMKFEFKEAREITVGDRLVWDAIGYEGVKTSLPDLGEEFHFNAKEVQIPELTSDVAWLIGLFQGDGHTTEKTLEIAGNMKELGTLARASAILKEHFLLDSTYGSDGRSGIGARLRANSAILARWFQKHIKKSCDVIRVPEFIMNATRDVRFAYLAGILDADGRVRNDGRIDLATTIYREFAEDLVVLLAGLGIGSCVSFGDATKRRNVGVDAKDFWTVSVAGNTNRKFFIEGCCNQSLKLVDQEFTFKSTVDFSFPIRWADTNQGYKANGNITVSAMRYDLPLLPSPVVAIEQGRKVETYDIEVEGLHRFTTNGVVVHNSALISLSNLSDDRMRYAKTGQWWVTDGQRSLANNSAVYTEKPEIGMFMREWLALYESKSGERGIFNREAARRKFAKIGRDWVDGIGCNPCAEIFLRSGGLCNLSEVVVRPDDTLEDLKRKVEIATIIGTWQSAMTNFRYISSIWKKNAEEERLLGVSLTGIMDHPVMCADDPEKLKIWLKELRDVAWRFNRDIAEMIGINPSKAITCLKPSGTVSQLVDSSSGIHTRHAPYYIRTVRADKKDPLAHYMVDIGFPVEDDVSKPEHTYVFSFPMKSPEESKFRDHLTAIQQLEVWKVYYENWCDHNPSCTIYVREHEWFSVGAWIYDNFDKIGGLSFLPYDDHVYKQAPYADITEKEYKEWLNRMPEDVDWSLLQHYETDDQTTGTREYACTAGACELV